MIWNNSILIIFLEIVKETMIKEINLILSFLIFKGYSMHNK